MRVSTLRLVTHQVRTRAQAQHAGELPFEQVGGDHAGDHRDEVRRARMGQGPLRPAVIGAAPSPDAPVGPGLGGRPFHGVVAVLGVVYVGTEEAQFQLAARGVPAAHVLYNGLRRPLWTKVVACSIVSSRSLSYGVRRRRVGKGPAPSGRNTSEQSSVPSRHGRFEVMQDFQCSHSKSGFRRRRRIGIPCCRWLSPACWNFLRRRGIGCSTTRGRGMSRRV